MLPYNNLHNYVEGNLFDDYIDLNNNLINWSEYLKSVNRQYFTFQVDGEGRVCIILSSRKPFKKNSALKTLTYLKNLYSDIGPSEDVEHLRLNVIHLAEFIRDNYFSHRGCFAFKADSEVALVCDQLCNRLSFCPALNIHSDIFKYIFKHLSFKDLCHFEQVNRVAFQQALWVWEVYAKVFNIQDDKPLEGRNKITRLGYTLDRLIGSEFLPPQAIKTTAAGKIDMSLTLKELRNNQKLLNKAFYNSLAIYSWNQDWKHFLALGADLVGKFENGHSTFLRAIEYKNDTVFKKILAIKYFDVNQPDDFGMTAAHLVASSGNVENMTRLSKRGGKLNVRNKQGLTPLHLASKKGHLDMVKFLIQRKVDVNARDKGGKTPLFYTLHTASVCDVLLKAGAFYNICLSKDNFMTPLHYAISNNNMDSIYLLLDAGADVNAPNAEGMTPLHLAVKKAHVRVLTHFKYEPCMESYITDGKVTEYPSYRKVTLFTYEIVGDESMMFVVEKLITLGANVNAVDKYGRVPLLLSFPKKTASITGSEVKSLRKLLKPF